MGGSLAYVPELSFLVLYCEYLSLTSAHPAKAALASAEARVADLGSQICVALEATATKVKAAAAKAAALGAQIGELEAALGIGS
jgi:hypothetical protein